MSFSFLLNGVFVEASNFDQVRSLSGGDKLTNRKGYFTFDVLNFLRFGKSRQSIKSINQSDL